jgi:DNA polymerase-3 subunit gamma/tau
MIEIDAASNRGINEMRELRESVRYRPARDRYKVFIIDEAHQITSEAFNALLKTLEEPPEWVTFMLCTTESHKIPTTIASRCQQFSFRSVDFAEIIGRMQWICEQEGIEADPDTLAVLAQAGEGSVRDSLSALDQAIACCGVKLNAGEVRGLLGMFSLDSLDQVAQALLAADSRRMLDIVLELERNGRNLQHFCRELSRYFRNLLVAKVAGVGTRLIAASPAEQERLAATAVQFSEEDLTRYLQLTLDLFKDLQFSLQPRLHLEIGLLKLVHVGRLLPIEEALAALKTGSSPAKPAAASARTPAPPPAQFRAPAPARAVPSPLERDTARKTAAPPEPGEWRDRLHAALLELGMNFTADAVEHSEVTEGNGEIRFITPEDFRLAMDTRDLTKVAQQIAGKPIRVKVEFGTPAGAPKPRAAADEASERALGHPEVKRFQEMFPDAHVRTVRDLKEG